MYTIKKVSDVAGVTLKTLRHYDTIGLLCPSARGENNYRLYNDSDLTKLQQIMFYKELEFPLDEIKRIVNNKGFEVRQSLEKQLQLLKAKKQRLANVIELAENTLKTFKGEFVMTNKEKFEAFKDKMITDNDTKYGTEATALYGEKTYTASKNKLKNMTEVEYKELEQLSIEVNNAFIVAKKTNNPQSAEAKKAVELHKKWLMHYWPEFNKDAYIGLANNYVNDERFAAYYNKLASGMAVFIRDCITAYFEA